jgi:hypothetical protein
MAGHRKVYTSQSQLEIDLKRGRSFFSVHSNRPTPLKYKPAASVRYQNNNYSNYRLFEPFGTIVVYHWPKLG